MLPIQRASRGEGYRPARDLRPETARVTRPLALSSQEPMAAGVTFNERMGGHVAACSSAPEEREDYRAGYREGTPPDADCHFEATMLIDNIAAYVRDPAHRAKMTGTFHWAPVGEAP